MSLTGGVEVVLGGGETETGLSGGEVGPNGVRGWA